MRILLIVIISVGVFFLLQNIIPTNEDFEIYEKTVRLHVIANSDSEQDQDLKLKVRNALLENIGDLDASSKEEAVIEIKKKQAQLTRLAKNIVQSNGMDYEVKIEIGKEVYPTRYYEDFALPAGEYTSVKVILGEGEGKNWWCVLYPPLCTASATRVDEDYCIQVGLSKEQYNLITDNKEGKYKIKFRFLEIFEQAFGFDDTMD